MGILDAPTYSRVAADARTQPFLRPRGDMVALGDSLMNNTALYTESPVFHADAYPAFVAALSGGAIRLVHNAGVSGNTTAQMLARFDTDVTPYAPGMVLLLAGTNDVYGGVTSLTTMQTNIAALVAKIRTIGAVPVLHTIPPNQILLTAGHLQLRRFNAWISRYAQSQGLVCIDLYALLTDPTNGNWNSAYDLGDHLHWSPAGQVAGAQLALTKLLTVVPPASPMLTKDHSDGANLLSGGTFNGTPASGIAGSWSNYGNANTGGNTASVGTDSQVIGKIQTITAVASTASGQVGQNIASSKFTVGDRIRVAGLLTIAGTTTGAYLGQVTCLFTGNGAQARTRFTTPVTRAQFEMETAIPTGTTSIDIILTANSGLTGSVSLGQATVYNLTAMGL